jgi:DNA mismatch repair protein MutS
MNLPMQYKSIKQKYPDALLLFRAGDYYECFSTDAETLYKHLGLTLHSFDDESLRCSVSFPHHSLDNYLRKLVRAGFRVAVCEQLEYPKSATG